MDRLIHGIYDKSITAKMAVAGIAASWATGLWSTTKTSLGAMDTILGIPIDLIPTYATIISTVVAVIGVVGNLVINYLKLRGNKDE